MATLLIAGFVSVDEIGDTLVVGFADRQFDTAEYFVLQRELDGEGDDGVYLEHTDQASGTYACVSLCALSPNRIELTIDEAAAQILGTKATFSVEFSCDPTMLHRLQTGLERIFSGTDCRLEVNFLQ